MSGWYFFYFLFALVACTSLEEERKKNNVLSFVYAEKWYWVFFSPLQFNRNVEETVPLAWYMSCAGVIFI